MAKNDSNILNFDSKIVADMYIVREFENGEN